MGNYFCKEIKYKSSPEEAQEKAIAIFELLNWRLKPSGLSEMRATTPISAFGWGEHITLTFPKEHRLRIESECVYPFQFFDLGKNQSNVEKFVEIFRKAKLPLEESEYGFEKRRSLLDRFFSQR
jgi:hypothetical protein